MTRVYVFRKVEKGDVIELSLSEKDEDWISEFNRYIKQGFKFVDTMEFK